MARYTELFAEWLENGGKMPAVFDNVEVEGEPLADIFIAYYAAREIGFETPELFELKFNALAAILINDLIAGLQAYSGALMTMDDPTDTHIKTGAIKREYGERKRNFWENPTATSATEIDLTDAGSQNITKDSVYTDTETYNNLIDIGTVRSVSDGVAVYKALSEPAKNFFEVWLNKFDALFMQIY